MEKTVVQLSSDLLTNAFSSKFSGIPWWGQLDLTASLINMLAANLLPEHLADELKKTAIPQCLAAGCLIRFCKLPPEMLILDTALRIGIRPHAQMLGSWTGHIVRALRPFHQ